MKFPNITVMKFAASLISGHFVSLFLSKSKPMESRFFILNQDTPVTDLGGGVSRQVLGYNDQLMTVKVIFKKGAIGELHTHTHSQTSYCADGKFEFTVGEEIQILVPGDGVYVAPGILHGVVCLEDGILVDSFNPVRRDFL